MSCFCAETVKNDWILDIGATDHMTPHLNSLQRIRRAQGHPKIKLPNGHSADITHTGHVITKSRLQLTNVLCVPMFKFNLLSVSKLIKDNRCMAIFFEKFCIIQDLHTRTLKGIGKEKESLYYLLTQGW